MFRYPKNLFIFFVIFSLALDFNFLLADKAQADDYPNTWSLTSVMVVRSCGDGNWDPPDEACDKGNPLLSMPPNFGSSTCSSYNDYLNVPYNLGSLVCSDECDQIIKDNCSRCQNGKKEGAEKCDGTDFGTTTCLNKGFNSGYLLCTSDCRLDTARCYSVGLNEPGTPGSSGGGSSGGGSPSGDISGFNPGSQTPPGQTKVVIKGKAYPKSDVHILLDGKVIGILQADAKADFYFETTEITPGVSTFGFWAENKEGIRSNAFSLTFRVVSGAVTTISGAYLAPSIGVDKNKVNKGDTVNIFGQSIPNADIYITINSDSEIVKQVVSDDIGAYTLAMNTSALQDEEFHLAKSLFQVQEGGSMVRSNYSSSVSFYVGKRGSVGRKCAGADLNGDGRVNLTDFSILLFNWGTANDCADQNHNGKVDLPDFSIMMYNWTG